MKTKKQMKKVIYFSVLTLTMLAFTACHKDSPVDEQIDEQKASNEFEYNGHKYLVVQELKTWADAAKDAVAQGGYLVEIGDEAEQNAVYKGILNAKISPKYATVNDGGGVGYVWIGAMAVSVSGTRVWIWNGAGKEGTFPMFWIGNENGSAVSDSYVNWGGKSKGKFNEPDNLTDPNFSPNGQNVAAIGLANWPQGSSSSLGIAGEWNDIAGTNKLYYVIEFDQNEESPSSIVYNTAVCGYWGDYFQTGTANFDLDMYNASNENIGVWIDAFSNLPSSFAGFSINQGSYAVSSDGKANTFLKGDVNDGHLIGTYVYNFDTQKFILVTGGTFAIARSGNTYSVVTNFTGVDYSTGNTVTDLKYSFTGTVNFQDKSGGSSIALSFSDIARSNFSATGTPGYLTTPGPSSWTGQVIPSSGQDQFYSISGWGGKAVNVYCDFKDGKIVIDSQTIIATDGDYEGYFRAIALDKSAMTYYIVSDYEVSYNKVTNTMDFTGTYNGLPVYVGVPAFDKNTSTMGGAFTELYSNAKLVLTPAPVSGVSQMNGSAALKAFSYSESITFEELEKYTMGRKQDIKQTYTKATGKNIYK